MVSIKGGKQVTFTIEVSLHKNQKSTIETLWALLYKSAFTSQRRFCSGWGWCTWDAGAVCSAGLPGLVPQQLHGEWAPSPGQRGKQELQWEEQGSVSKPSAFPDCSSKSCLLYTTCCLQRCGTIHALDLWSHLGCSYTSLSSLWPVVRDYSEHFTKSVCFPLLHNEKKSRKRKAERTFLSKVSLTEIALVSLGLRCVYVFDSVRTQAV